MHPNRAPDSGTSAAGGGCLGVVGLVVVVLAGLVAIGGFFASSLIGTVAPNRGLSEMRAKGIEDFAGRPWTGTVTCSDGERRIRVQFTRQRRGQTHVDARVRWRGTEDRYDASGTFDGTRLRVEPEWGSRRQGDFRPVALVGSVTEADVDQEAGTVDLISIAGNVAGDEACSTFELSR